MSEKIQTLAGIDRIVHEPARLMIVALLAAVDEADFQYLHQATGLTKGNLSVHLSKLEDAGYVANPEDLSRKVSSYPVPIDAAGQRGVP